MSKLLSIKEFGRWLAENSVLDSETLADIWYEIKHLAELGSMLEAEKALGVARDILVEEESENV